jgi:uncharacterized protein YndB with AHSA1/START domain
MTEMSFTYVHQASPELVFTCLTTPEHLTHFWGPRGSHAPAEGIRIDLRPGGRFDAVIISDANGPKPSTRCPAYRESRRPAEC